MARPGDMPVNICILKVAAFPLRLAMQQEREDSGEVRDERRGLAGATSCTRVEPLSPFTLTTR
jgi:hypothetical protein